MAPELIEQRGATFASDVWAVAVMAYYLYKGVRPFNKTDDDTYRISRNIRILKYELHHYDEPYFVEFIKAIFKLNNNERPMAANCINMPMFSNNWPLRKAFKS